LLFAVPTVPIIKEAPYAGLDQVDDLLMISMRNSYHPEVFNEGSQDTNAATAKIKDAVKNSAPFPQRETCWVCGKKEQEIKTQLSVAHIIRNNNILKKTFDIKWDISNFIVLCGTKGEKGTCHYYFDTYQMSFMHQKNEGNNSTATSNSTNKWIVLGGGELDGKKVILYTKPHKRTMYSHLTRCKMLKSLKTANKFKLEDLEKSDEIKPYFSNSSTNSVISEITNSNSSLL
jgi:hypothetical protein